MAFEENYRPDPVGDIPAPTHSSPSPPSSANFPAAGLTAYWKMNEDGGQRRDSSGHGRHLAQYGFVGVSSGVATDGASFSGSASDYLASSDPVFQPVVAWSFSLWFKLNTLDEEQTIISKWSGNDIELTSAGWRLWVNDGHKLVWTEGDAVIQSTYELLSTQDIEADTWYHVVVGVNLDPLVNSAYMVINNGAADTSEALTPTDPEADMMIGRDGEGEYFLDGVVDEVGIWMETLLTDAQVAALYNGGTPLPF